MISLGQKWVFLSLKRWKRKNKTVKREWEFTAFFLENILA